MALKKSRKCSRTGAPRTSLSLLAMASLMALGCALPAMAETTCDGAGNCILANPMTPSTFNNGAGSLAVSSGTVNLTGTASYSGSTAPNISYMSLRAGYNAGYFTAVGDAVDPNTAFTLNAGAQSNGVAVADPISGGSITVNTYTSGSLQETVPGGDNWTKVVYFPTSSTGGPMVGARIADVSGGATLNFNVSGNIGNTSTRDTVFIKVTDGVANWNSQNTIVTAQGSSTVTAASLQPYNVSMNTQTYARTFTVTLTDGSQVQQTVTDLTSLKAYNDWLIAQLKAGKLGSGSAAQTNYNNAFAQAYVTTTSIYQINPDPQSIPATDPLFSPLGTRAAMQADGPNATARIGTTGFLSANYGNGLYATNGGTIINDGTLITQGGQTGAGMMVESGGHAINNGVRFFGPNSGTRTDAGYDTVTGAGSTYLNTGVMNLVGWNYSTTTPYTAVALRLYAQATATNQGAINVGTTTQIAAGYPTGVTLYGTGATFINDTAGVMYVGREQSTDTTLAPIDRGGADVAQPNGGRLVNIAASGANVDNRGVMIIGDLVQNGVALDATATGAMNVVNSGTIEVRGHYSATPQPNIAIRSVSSAAGTVVNNAGTINLTGVNVIGIKTLSGGKAQSSGTINIVSGSDPATGLRNYGIWSEGSGSLVDLSGTVNLSGDGAIGVHARSSGGVAISGNGQVVFSSGTNQIGYFAYGVGASITNTGTGAQDVSTANSVLFRMEDGANFTGGSGAASALTASGANTTAVVVTGVTGTNVSAFNSGGMTLNLTGSGATGVLVEGGAQGKITSDATINLTGIGAIAGIADGQKHALDGSATGSPIAGLLSNASLSVGASGFGTGTILVAGANLNSALDQVTGYIAKNGASLNNSGNIVFTGANTTGIQVLEGSTGGNTGSITLQDGGIGLIASSSSAVTTLNNSGNLVLKGGTNASRTTGISATGSSVTVNMTAGTIDMQGQGAIGVSAYDGATVNLSGTAVPQFAADGSGITDQVAFLVSGAGSSINTNIPAGTLLDASGTNATLFRVENGATQSGVLQMKTSGTGSRGIWATGDNTTVVAAAGSDFQVLGKDAMSVLVEGGAHVTLNAGTTVSLVGNGAIVGLVDGNEYTIDGVTVTRENTDAQLINNATLTSGLSNATGFVTQNAGLLVNNGSIDFTSGANNIGVKVLNGQFENHADITINGVGVYVEGELARVDVQGGQIKASNGEAAIKIGQDASLNLVGSGLGVVTASGTAHAVLLDTGAAGLVIGGAYIDMASSGAGTGNGVENRAEIAGIQLTSTTRIDVMDGKGIRTAATLAATNAGTINVMGSGTGLAFETASGSAMSNAIDFSDSNGLTIKVTGANGTGISVNHIGGGDVKNGANVIVAAGGGSAVELSGVATFTNTGSLTSLSTAAPVVDLGNAVSVTNTATGVISSVTGTALVFDGQNSALTNSGRIDGLVEMGDGNNTVLLNAGSTTGSVTAGSGANAFMVMGNAVFTYLDGGIGGGDDTLTFDGVTYTLSPSDIDHFELIKLTNASTLTTADLIKMTDTAGGVGAIDIDASSVLNLRPAAGYTLDHALSGAGVISAIMGSGADAFAFGTGASNQFAGTLQAGTGTFALAGDNTTALTKATLRVDTGNVTTVGSGNQTIGGLAFNGGTMVFDATIPGDRVAASTVTTTVKLDASGTGTIQVSAPAGFVNDQPMPNTRVSLLEQDDETALVQLVSSTGTTVGTGGALKLVDQTGTVISNALVLDITQGGTKVAEGTYDYRLSTGAAQDGLYVSYGLTLINLIGTGTDALILAPATGATGMATDQSAKVTGSGDLTVMAGAGNTVSLSNTLNDYTGVTTASTGTLQLGVDEALGQTSNLIVASTGIVDMNGKSQSVGAVNTLAGGQLIITSGSTLTIDDNLRLAGGTSGGALDAATLFGAGTFVIDPSVVTVNGAQSGFTGLMQVTGGSQVIMNTANAFDNAQGIELVGANDKATFGDLSGVNAAWTAIPNGSAAVSFLGIGTVETRDGSNVTLSGDSTNFSGHFDVGASSTLTASEQKNIGTASILASGTFVADHGSDWVFANPVTGEGTFAKQGAGTMTLDQALAGFSGLTEVRAGTLIVGDAATPGALIGGSAQVLAGATLSGTGTIAGSVTNRGNIPALNALSSYSDSDVSNLTISGNLTNSGTVKLAGTTVGNTLTVGGTYESNGGSLSLNTVLGDSSSLTDKLIANAVTTGSGATSIYVTNVNGLGALTTGDGIQVVQVATSSSSDAFVLGRPVTVGAYEYILNQGADQSWYLSSYLQPEPGQDSQGSEQAPLYSPATGAYLSNQTAATTLFMHTLYDRRGHDTRLGSDGQSGWARMVTRHGTGESVGGSQATRTSSDLIHFGADVGTWQVAAGNLHVGIMGAYGKSKAKVTSKATGTWAEGRLDGYGLGVYGTWFADEAEGKGLYVDSWAQYTWIKNKINGTAQVKGEEKYDSRLWTVSAEAGYGFMIGKTANTEIMLTPQIQVAYNDYSADTHTDANDLRVSGDGGSGVVTRVGMRLYGRSTSVFTARPYVEANWLYSDARNTLNFNGEMLRDEVPHNRLEAKLGIQGTITKSWTAWGQAGVQWGKDSYHRYEGQFGLKYRW